MNSMNELKIMKALGRRKNRPAAVFHEFANLISGQMPEGNCPEHGFSDRFLCFSYTGNANHRLFVAHVPRFHVRQLFAGLRRT